MENMTAHRSLPRVAPAPNDVRTLRAPTGCTIPRLIMLAPALLLCGLAAAPARAAYTLIPTADGLSTRTVAPGDPFRLDVTLTSDAADQHNSAIFQLFFTEPGLVYQSYDWAAPYADGPPFDDSTPLLADLPAALDADLLTGPGHPAGVTDVELSNVLIGSTFGVGTLVSLDLLVPADFAFRGSLFIAAVPDTFADGFDEIPAASGQVFELIIVPAPPAWPLLLLLPLLRTLPPRRRVS